MVNQLKLLAAAWCELLGGVGAGHPWHKSERTTVKHLASLSFSRPMVGLRSVPILRHPDLTEATLADLEQDFPRPRWAPWQSQRHTLRQEGAMLPLCWNMQPRLSRSWRPRRPSPHPLGLLLLRDASLAVFLPAPRAGFLYGPGALCGSK